MKAILPLFVFIDAFGWEIAKDRTFARAWAPERKRLESVFGYSSACVPSILSGHWPVENRNWCYFVYDPKHSPFRWLKPLRWLPTALTGRRRFRRLLSKAVKRQMSFNGYFDLYNVPFAQLPLFDFSEKRSPLKPGGMNHGQNIFDFLELNQIAYHVSDPNRREQENLDELCGELRKAEIDFAFVYLPELDGLMHRVGNQSPEVGLKLRAYELWIERLLETALEHYEQVRLYIFSDHGMANCMEHLDLMARIEALPLRMGKDYAVVYDSTMARFWFLNPQAREMVTRCLEEIPEGRILPDDELERLHCLFFDRYFGELIFLVKEGVLVVPSHMGQRPICAMHGYHPSEKNSYAALLSNQTIPQSIEAIPDIFRLMTRDAALAKHANEKPAWLGAPEQPLRAASG